MVLFSTTPVCFSSYSFNTTGNNDVLTVMITIVDANRAVLQNPTGTRIVSILLFGFIFGLKQFDNLVEWVDHSRDQLCICRHGRAGQGTFHSGKTVRLLDNSFCYVRLTKDVPTQFNML